MRWIWLAVIVVCAVPAAGASLLLNPLVFVLLGADAWWEQVARLAPLRWWILASLLGLGLATAVYATRYA